jgi:hypothetical protein
VTELRELRWAVRRMLTVRRVAADTSAYDRSVLRKYGTRDPALERAGAALELTELHTRAPRAARAPRARRIRCARRRTTTRAGVDPPPSENASTPGRHAGGTAQNIGKVARVQLTRRSR